MKNLVNGKARVKGYVKDPGAFPPSMFEDYVPLIGPGGTILFAPAITQGPLGQTIWVSAAQGLASGSRTLTKYNQAEPFNSFTEAFAAAEDGDTLLVLDGNFSAESPSPVGGHAASASIHISVLSPLVVLPTLQSSVTTGTQSLSVSGPGVLGGMTLATTDRVTITGMRVVGQLFTDTNASSVDTLYCKNIILEGYLNITGGRTIVEGSVISHSGVSQPPVNISGASSPSVIFRNSSITSTEVDGTVFRIATATVDPMVLTNTTLTGTGNAISIEATAGPVTIYGNNLIANADTDANVTVEGDFTYNTARIF